MFAYFIGQGRPVEVKKGGKISMTLGHLIITCYIMQQLIKFFIYFFRNHNKFSYIFKLKNRPPSPLSEGHVVSVTCPTVSDMYLTGYGKIPGF